MASLKAAFVEMSQTKGKPVSETVRYVFNEFDEDKDGWMSRREFFHFLVDVRSEPSMRLTEGQMISCWGAVKKAKGDAGPIDIEEFAAALEQMYATNFFAAENGIAVPTKVIRTSKDAASTELPENMYNTIKFKKSPAVAMFDELIEEEKREKQKKEEREREKAARKA